MQSCRFRNSIASDHLRFLDRYTLSPARAPAPADCIWICIRSTPSHETPRRVSIAPTHAAAAPVLVPVRGTIRRVNYEHGHKRDIREHLGWKRGVGPRENTRLTVEPPAGWIGATRLGFRALTIAERTDDFRGSCRVNRFTERNVRKSTGIRVNALLSAA